MNRRAILIGCPNTPGQRPLPGTEKDVVNYTSFLASRIGGDWRSNEIVTMLDPSKAEVRQAIVDASECDYVFVLFSGHGSHPQGNRDQLSTRIRVADGSMAARQLDPGNGRCTIVIDSCRTPGVVVESVSQLFVENRRIAARRQSRPSRQDYRKAFDAAVLNCPEQTIYLFGCSIGQSAKDDAHLGGLFPRALITVAVEWERNQTSRNNLLTIGSSFTKAAMLVALDSSLDQIPRDSRNIPDGLHFPFALFRI